MSIKKERRGTKRPANDAGGSMVKNEFGAVKNEFNPFDYDGGNPFFKKPKNEFVFGKKE